MPQGLCIVVWALVLFMCSARARMCRAQCDVLVIAELVTILPHIFSSHSCACACSCSCVCCCCCCCCCSTCNAACCPLFLNPWKSSYLFPIQSSSAPTIPSHHLRLITIGKLNMWGYLVLQLRFFLPRVLTMFLCQCLAKHWYLRSFHQVVRCSFYMRKG